MLAREKRHALLLNDFPIPHVGRESKKSLAQDQAYDTDKIIRQRVVTIHLIHDLEIELFLWMYWDAWWIDITFQN